MDTSGYNTVPCANGFSLKFHLSCIRNCGDPGNISWVLELIGVARDIEHCVSSNPSNTYPTGQQIAEFFNDAASRMKDWASANGYLIAEDADQQIAKFIDQATGKAGDWANSAECPMVAVH